MAKEKLIGADYLLLLLYLNNKAPILGAVRLTKMMFLFNEEVVPALGNDTIDKLPDFIPYDFGPFSKDIYEQVELFKNIRFINVVDINSIEDMDEVDDWEESPYIDELYQNEYYEKESNSFEKNKDNKLMKYSIAQLGIKYIESNILPKITPEHLTLLQRFKDKINTVSIRQLLHYVYIKYPDYTDNSKIKERVLGHN